MSRARRRTARHEIDTGPTPVQRAAWRLDARVIRARVAFLDIGDHDASIALANAQRAGDGATLSRLLAAADARFGPPEQRAGRYREIRPAD